MSNMNNFITKEDDNHIQCRGIYQNDTKDNLISKFQNNLLSHRFLDSSINEIKLWSSSHFIITKNEFKISGGFDETLNFMKT